VIVTTSAPRPSLVAIFSVFFQIGIFSFGGGLLGWVYREVVTKRHWLEEDDIMSGMAVSQILPGANVTNLAVYVGQRLRGPVGAVVAFVALLVGPFFYLIAAASLYGVVSAFPRVEEGMQGVAAAAIGLVFIIVGRGVYRSVRRPASILAFLATFAAVGLLHWPLLAVVAVVGPLSVWAAWPRGSDA
jgi:chromate transporter